MYSKLFGTFKIYVGPTYRLQKDSAQGIAYEDGFLQTPLSHQDDILQNHNELAECSAESDRHTKSSCANYHDIAFDNCIIG